MAVVVDVHTGDVLAMATVDGANDGVPRTPGAPARTRTAPLTDLFEPGSTNKLITIATAIEHGKVGPNTEFNVPATHQRRRGRPRRTATTHRDDGMERWSTTDILRESSNVGTIMIAEVVVHQTRARSRRSATSGSASAPSIDFPGQPNGLLLDPDAVLRDRPRLERDRLRRRGHRDADGRRVTRRSPTTA